MLVKAIPRHVLIAMASNLYALPAADAFDMGLPSDETLKALDKEREDWKKEEKERDKRFANESKKKAGGEAKAAPTDQGSDGDYGGEDGGDEAMEYDDTGAEGEGDEDVGDMEGEDGDYVPDAS